jgi:hypothetical protein
MSALLSFLAQAHAQEVAANDMNDSHNSMDEFEDELVEKMANKLADRVDASFLRNSDLDSTTLGKPGNVAIPQQNNLPVQTSYGQGQDDDRALADFEEEQLEEAAMLDLMLSLRGGAAMKAMKAMKAMAAAKSPRPSEMKKKKPLNPYMAKLMEARKSNAKSFAYNGKTYVQAKTKSGMIIYKAK